MLLRKSTPWSPDEDEGRRRPPFPFIVGCPRSGTSLLTQMVSSHPDMAIPQETHFIPKIIAACRSAADPRKAFLETIRSHFRWGSFGIDDALLDRKIAELEPFNTADAVRTFYQLYADSKRKPRYGDKTPPYQDHMIVIQDLLPEARFIHIVRDGRDVALSIKDLEFGPNTIPEIASWWCLVLWRTRAQVEDLRHYLEIRYEDLVLDTENTIRAVCDFVELPWNDSSLRYYEKFDDRWAEIVRGRADTSYLASPGRKFLNELLARPPQTDRVAAWKREMSIEDQDRFVEVAEDVLEQFGYPHELSASYAG